MRALTILILIAGSATAGQPMTPGVPALFFEGPSGAILAQAPGMRANFDTEAACIQVHDSGICIEAVGAVGVQPRAVEPQQARYSRFSGGPSNWRQGLRVYGGVEYPDIYPGVAMRWSALKRQLKSEFRIAPGASVEQIRLHYRGALDLSIEENGALAIRTEKSVLREEPPDAWQVIDGVRKDVSIRYRLSPANDVEFEVGQYDASLPLWIDPLFSYGSYFGGSSTDVATSVAVDSSGNMYIAGYTASADLPLASPVQSIYGKSVDAFVAKFNPAGNQLLYATYLGSVSDDRAMGLAVDSSGNAIVVGYTSSSAFPTYSASQPAYGGSKDAFIAKINPAGTALVFSTFFGGTGADVANAVALDTSGNIYVAGDTRSTDLPLLGPAQSGNHGLQDGFIAKFGPGGNRLYSTYLGSSGDERTLAIAVDSTGSAYVAGATTGPDFPVLNAFQSSNAGGQDGYVAKLNPAGNALVFSTYLGGSGGSTSLPEVVNAIALDASRNVYIAGVTPSTNFPVLSAFQSTLKGGGQDAFVAKLSSTGQSLIFSSYLGGLGLDSATSIALDTSGFVYVGGNTRSTDFPVPGATQAVKAADYDAFLVQINSTPSILFGTFLGGGGADGINALAVSRGTVYAAGQTLSTDFPRNGAYQTYGYTDGSAFLARYLFSGTPSNGTVSPPSPTTATQTFTYTFTHTAGYTTFSNVWSLINTSTFPAGGCMWNYNVVKNELSLLDDAGAKYIGPITPSSGTTLQNSQCTIGGPGTTITGSGTTLTVVLPIQASPFFSGSRKIYLYSRDVYGTEVGWDMRGTWTLPITGSPSFGSISPASGTGTGATFTFPFKHSGGYAQLVSVYGLISPTTNTTAACLWKYNQSTNSLYLLDDLGKVYLGPISATGGTTLHNSQCTIGGTGTSITSAADTMTVVLPIVFSGSFPGTKNIYMYASDTLNQGLGFIQKGTWTIPGSSLPSVTSVTPSTGSGASATLSYVFSHAAGYAKLNYVYGLVNGVLSVANACMWKLSPATGNLWLLSDDANTYLGPVLAGGTGTLQNKQCTIAASSVSATGSGNTFTVNLTAVFFSAFGGLKNVYLDALDTYGQETGFVSKGTWMVPGGSTPSAVSVSPSAAAGGSVILLYRFSDTGGAAQIAAAFSLIQNQISLANSCMWKYVPATNSFYLLDDAAATYLGPLAAASTWSLQNSQCILSGSSSAMSVGNNLDVTVVLSSKPGFSGLKNQYLYVQDVNTNADGWANKGTWTTP